MAKRGRPPAGREGAMVKDYGRFTLRLSPSGMALLDALSAVLGRPKWSVVESALEAFPDSLEPSQRKLVRQLARANLVRAAGDVSEG